MPLFVWHPRPADVRLIVSLLKKTLRNQQLIAERMEYIAENLERKIAMSNEEIQNEINDLKAATALIGAGVGTLKTNLSTALDKISELEAAGVSPETIANLRDAVNGAQEIAGQFEAAADPSQPTPGEGDLPDPVEPAPATPETGDEPTA